MGNPLRIFILSFSILNWGNFDDRISDSRAMIGLVDVLRRSPDPKWYIYPCVISSEGESLANFLFCTFHVGIGRRFRWHEASVWVIKPAQALYPSDMPMSEPINRGNPLRFLFCILQSRIKRILTRGFARGRGWSGWCSKRRCVQPLPLPNPTDVYFLHLSCRDVLNKTSILTVVGGSAGVSLS